MDILRPALLAVALVACAPSLAGFGEIPDAAVAPDATGGDAAPAEATVRPDTAEDTADASDGAATPDAAPVADAAVEAAPDASEVGADVGTEVVATDAGIPEVGCAGTTAGNCCGVACLPRANSTPACVAGACVIGACAEGFEDCDRNPSNGCEVDTSTDAHNCGTCGASCVTGRVCRAGACVTPCVGSLADCDGIPTNRCEVDLASDPRNCGACGTRCNPGQACLVGRCR